MKKNLMLLLMGLIILLSTINVMARPHIPHKNQPTDSQPVQKGMIKVTILYAGGEGKKFDMDYYMTKHIPMVKSLLAGALKLTAIDKGIAGSTPGSSATYVVICYLYFDSVSAYQTAMSVNGAKIRGDIANYTNIVPVIQISEVVE